MVLVVAVGATAGLAIHSADRPYDDWDAFGHGLGSRALVIPPEITLADHDFGVAFADRPFDVPSGRISKDALAELFAESWSQWPPPPWLTPHIEVSKTTVHLDISDLTLPIPTDAEHGLDARFKRSGREDRFLVPLAQSLEWIWSHFHDLANTTGQAYAMAGVTLVVDRDVPFRVLSEVLFTSGQSMFQPSFVVRRNGQVVVLAGVGLRTGPWPPPFRVAMNDDGFVVSAKGMPVETIAKKRDGYDYAALNDAGNRWKAAAIENVPETAALITPAPNVHYQDFLRAQAALRTTDGQDLFPLAQGGWDR